MILNNIILIIIYMKAKTQIGQKQSVRQTTTNQKKDKTKEKSTPSIPLASTTKSNKPTRTSSLAQKFLEYSSVVLDSARYESREVEPSSNKLFYSNTHQDSSKEDLKQTFNPSSIISKGNNNMKNLRHDSADLDSIAPIINTNETNTNTQIEENKKTEVNKKQINFGQMQEFDLKSNNTNFTNLTNNTNNVKGQDSNLRKFQATPLSVKHLNQSITSKQSALNNNKKTDISLLQSIHSESKLTEKKKLQNIFKNLVTQKETYLDIDKEMLFSNQSSNFFDFRR